MTALEPVEPPVPSLGGCRVLREQSGIRLDAPDRQRPVGGLKRSGDDVGGEE